jgi:hypothetical protein
MKLCNEKLPYIWLRVYEYDNDLPGYRHQRL